MVVYLGMTKKQLCQNYGVTRQTLYRWLKEKGLVFKNRVLTPAQLELVYKKLGEPKHIVK